jgi:hypothetical protein
MRSVTLLVLSLFVPTWCNATSSFEFISDDFSVSVIINSDCQIVHVYAYQGDKTVIDCEVDAESGKGARIHQVSCRKQKIRVAIPPSKSSKGIELMANQKKGYAIYDGKKIKRTPDWIE